MINTIYGKKMAMTAVYTPKGKRLGATVVQVADMQVTAQRVKEKHGYSALVVRIKRDKGADKTREIRTDEMVDAGTDIKFEESFKVGDKVDVAGITLGHGFTGVVKRYNFRGGPATHGQSDRERARGSSGSTTTPGRVFAGKRMAGRMGNDRVKVKNLEILDINSEKKTMTISGSLPGSSLNLLTIVKK
jgi:large subunit ribosomal protein L3